MKNGLLGILTTLSRKKDAVVYQTLNEDMTGFRAIPANGKRFKKNEPLDATEITFIGNHSDAKGMFLGHRVGFVIWVDADEYNALVKKEAEQEGATQ